MKSNTSDLVKQIKGEQRRLHFEAKGSLAEWRGLHHVHESKRRQNRRQIKLKAIAGE